QNFLAIRQFTKHNNEKSDPTEVIFIYLPIRICCCIKQLHNNKPLNHKSMKKLQYIIQINAPAQVVYDKMLGLSDKRTYEAWTAAFNPTSSYEGDWSEGSKIYFVGEHEGKKSGMVSMIEQHK